MERPELDRLRDDAQKGVFDAVLINDVDRLARDVAHLGVIKRDLERKGIKVIFRKLPSDTSPTYNLMVNILGSFAEFERELIADRTRRGRRHKVEVRKQYLGRTRLTAIGIYPKDRLAGTEGILEIPAEAAVVRQMFEWVDQDGLSARRVLESSQRTQDSAEEGRAALGKVECAADSAERNVRRDLALQQISRLRTQESRHESALSQTQQVQRSAAAARASGFHSHCPSPFRSFRANAGNGFSSNLIGISRFLLAMKSMHIYSKVLSVVEAAEHDISAIHATANSTTAALRAARKCQRFATLRWMKR